MLPVIVIYPCYAMIVYNNFYVFFLEAVRWDKFKEEPLTSLDKISENFVRRADGRFKSSNKEKMKYFLKIIILLNLYARIMYYVALLWEYV